MTTPLSRAQALLQTKRGSDRFLPVEDAAGLMVEWAEGEMGRQWRTMETAPRDGTEILCIDAQGNMRVCYPKLFRRPLDQRPKGEPLDDWMNRSEDGDRWEYFRDEANAPGHTWSMIPTHWMPLPQQPTTESE